MQIKIEEPEIIKPCGNQRDTKRWCRGKNGVPHQFDWVLKWHYGSSKCFRKDCIKCGRASGEHRYEDDLQDQAHGMMGNTTRNPKTFIKRDVERLLFHVRGA